MKIKLILIFLFVSLKVFAQSDYNLFMSLTTEENLRMNSPLISVTIYQLDNGSQLKQSLQEFNQTGFPTSMIQYDGQEKIAMKKVFLYDSLKCIKSIESYKNDKHEKSSEFIVNRLGQIIECTEYVYSSYSGEKLAVGKTLLDYNRTGTLSKLMVLRRKNQDTCLIDFYDNNGIRINTIMNQPGLRTKKIEYLYNQDSTEMLEKQYDDENNNYNTIIHKYKDKKEIERVDESASPKPFYWKYDDKGKVIETNEGLYYILYNIYNPSGYMTNMVIEEQAPDSDTKNLTKKIEYKYEYQFKK